MSKIGFNLKYTEKRFINALKDNNLELAHNILLKSPPAQTPPEELQRLVFLVQSYKELIEASNIKYQGLLKDYSLLGTPSQIIVSRRILDNYRKLGSLDEVKSKLGGLHEFANISVLSKP